MQKAKQANQFDETQNLFSAKKPYRKPQLLQYGLLSVITQGTGSMNADSVAGRRKN